MRFYTRNELAKITGTNIEDSKHFKRNAENVLIKWGYGYSWINGKGVQITHVPDTPREKLQEILVRQFHVDIQTDMYAFACFISIFDDKKSFASMPWKEREKLFYQYSGVFVCDKTLSHWCKILKEQDIVSFGTAGSYWKSYTVGYEKYQVPVTKKEAQDYFNQRSALLKEFTEENEAMGLKYEDAVKEAWKEVYRELWNENHCCYYSCKTIMFAAWNENGELQPVYDLSYEIRKERKNG